MSKLEQHHGNYLIKINRIPETQFDEVGMGFGWGFQIFLEQDKLPVYAVVVKSFLHQATKQNVESAYALGIGKVKELLDNDTFDENYVCYKWDPANGLMRVACQDISPGIFRSPLP